MATEAGELIVKISADVSNIKSQLSQMSSNVQDFSTSTITKGVLIGTTFTELGKAAIRFGVDSVKAFGQQEAAMARLQRQVGVDTARAFSEYAGELQKTTTFTDESIVAMQSQLANFGLLPGSIQDATKPLLDYAAATGKTLPEAAAVLTKALSGNSRELKQMGLDLNVSDGRAGNLDKSIQFLTNRFHGMSEQLKGTAIGTIENFNNRIQELKESVGKDLVTAIDFWRPKAEAMISIMERITGSARNDLSVRELGIKKLQSEAETLKLALQGNIEYRNTIAATQGVAASGDEAMRDRLKMVTDQIKLLKQQGTEEKKLAVDTRKGLQQVRTEAQDAAEAKISALKMELQVSEEVMRRQAEMSTLVTQKKIMDSQMELIQMQADQTQITVITQTETQKRLLQSQMLYEANASYSDQLKVKLADDMARNTTAWVDMTTTMIDSFASATARMIMEGGKFSQVVQQLWMQLAEMVIQQILRMIAQWLVWQAMTGGAGGFAGGFLGRGAAGGMINEPSMILGMKSGTAILAGEAGPEAFGPAGTVNSLNSGSAARSSGGGGGGGGGTSVTVNITGQFIEGSPTKWQRLIQERIAPEIRRTAMKDPNSLITRKRGSLS